MRHVKFPVYASGRDAGSDNIHHASPRNNFLNHDLSSGRCPVMGVEKLPCTGIPMDVALPVYPDRKGIDPIIEKPGVIRCS